MWNGLEAHCPACHKSFPLHKIENEKLAEWRKEQQKFGNPKPTTDLDRRLHLLTKSEKGKKPHASQIPALASPNRHIVGQGPARCIEENERIVLSDGSVVPIKDLKGTFFTVPAFGVLGEQVPAKAFAEDNGVKPVFRVTTNNGRSIVRTGNHPLLHATKLSGQGTRTQISSTSWKPISEIQPGDLVLAPQVLDVEGQEEVPDEQVELLGLLLGDGGVIQSVTFTQAGGGPLIEDFKRLVRHFGCRVRVDEREDGIFQLHVAGNPVNHIIHSLREWGLFGKHSRDKFFPEWVWRLPNRQLALLLNRLYACDGWATADGEIGYSSASERLIRDIELACLRLGVCGRVRARLANYSHKGERRSKKAWCFDVTRSEYVLRFAQLVGIRGKEAKVQAAAEAASKKNPDDRWRCSGVPENYEWQVVKSVEPLGLRPTVNITVDTYHTFITTLVEHNTGKSHCLSMFGFMFLMIPGAETWLLAATFSDAERELNFILDRLHTAFYPVQRHMYEVILDKKTGDARITTRWGSILEVKSAKSKHSITGHELEGILVAEPGWVDADLLEEVRARMSSRLGRIIAMGSPKGFGGFLGRLVRISQRDGRSGKRLTPGSKMVENGCPWGESILQYHLKAQDNPQYVRSELEAAKKELTEAEYASEFEGRMAGDTDRKFPQIKDDHLVRISRDTVRDCQFVLGVDQGERNFGGCLLAWDGEIIRIVWEYFDNSEKTIKSNLITLNDTVPPIITLLGGQPTNWQLTIFDADPKVDYQLLELQNENRGWKTEITLRPKNQTDTINWREETCQWLNEMAREGRLLFAAERTDFLHEQLKEALIPKMQNETDAIDLKRKRWVIHDPIRKDHVADAFLMACYTLYANMVIMPSTLPTAHSPFEEARRAAEFRRIADERRELNGSVDENRLFRSIFGRDRFGDTTLNQTLGGRGWYDDY